MSLQFFQYNQSFCLESGYELPGFRLAYHTFGTLNENADNVVWVFHALTANSNPLEWWPGLVGTNTLFDPKEFFIVCVNMPGSFYGSISPLDINSQTNKKFYHGFPAFTTLDMIRTFQHLKASLGIQYIKYGLGGSMGGQQLLQWAIEEPSLFEHIIPIATNASHSQWGIAFNESQRWAIETDATWLLLQDDAGIAGMKAARSIALLSYRNYHTYAGTVTNHDPEKNGATYQRHQGEKLAARFNAFSYYFLSKSMDSHSVARHGLSITDALKQIKAKCLVVGISSDILFPVTEQVFLAEHITGASLSIIDSYYGHDGFLLEYEAIANAITNWKLHSTNRTGKNEPVITEK